MTQIIEHLSDISDRYDALFVDLWGCVHNGVKAFPDAVAALRSYRERGGKVEKTGRRGEGGEGKGAEGEAGRKGGREEGKGGGGKRGEVV